MKNDKYASYTNERDRGISETEKHLATVHNPTSKDEFLDPFIDFNNSKAIKVINDFDSRIPTRNDSCVDARFITYANRAEDFIKVALVTHTTNVCGGIGHHGEYKTHEIVQDVAMYLKMYDLHAVVIIIRLIDSFEKGSDVIKFEVATKGDTAMSNMVSSTPDRYSLDGYTVSDGNVLEISKLISKDIVDELSDYTRNII